MKALIKVGYGCNENCGFCHTLDVRHVDAPRAEVDTKIRRAARLGHSMAVLSGGEPTIRPELVHWAELSASLGLDFGLVTNGLRLSYPKLVERLIELRLKYVYLSLHGGTARVHNRMVRSDTFEAAHRAVRTLAGRGLDLTANCVVTRGNLGELRPLVDLMRPYPEWAVQFSMVEPKGGALHEIERTVPPVSEVAARVRDAIDYGRSRALPGQRFFYGGIPLCLMAGDEGSHADLKTHGFRTMTEVGEGDLFPIDTDNKVQTARCHGCPSSGPCPGLYRAYEAAYGDAELSPPEAAAPRGNSFNYTFEARVRSTSDYRCPLLEDGVSPWDRGRDLFVRNGARIARYRAATLDFSDAAIAATKHDRGQIYVDLSGKEAPDDFARDLLLLERSPICAPCPEFDRCTGLYEPLYEDVFSRDDREVHRILESLRGRVLDVGCGEAPYAATLSDLGRSGRISYLGIDPDAEAIARLRRREPWGSYRVGDVRSLGGELSGPFDHVLVLRSWNHLDDPESDLRRLLPAIRPGGTLTLVDNVVFGLVRSRRQTDRAESSAARREHLRNHDSEDARRVAERVSGFRLVALKRRQVAPGCSNQWVLHYRVSHSSQIN